jgi:tricorn protease interacting factor F2/3
VAGIEVEGARSPFALDAATFEVENVAVNGKVAPFKLDNKRSKMFVSNVPRRRTLVEIAYTKQVSNDVIFGLYKSKYGKDYALATDLEPAQARTVFPCVDEPAYKAVFRLRITTESGLKVIGNTPVERTQPAGDGRTTYFFQQTPPMSTYLFFFAVGDFEETRRQADAVEVITATRPGQAKNSVLALEFASKSLTAYERYFGVPYPLRKLHVVALPEYHTGAMENWGAISSRESYALATDDTSFAQKNRAALSMVHEVAHQWFGDLVTMEWWDDLWLNESFATFMSYKMTGVLRPDWEMWGVFLRDETFQAMNLDALSTTHPVQAHVKDVAEAAHTFDAISYGKGASVLRMLEAYVGEDAFRTGVSDYLKKFSFGNASGRDLWQALGKASGLPVTKVAREWLTIAGYPVVQVRTSKGKIDLVQRPFRLHGSKARGLWPIPISLRADGQEKSIFLNRRSIKVVAAFDDELLLNLNRTGFYATLYDARGYERLARNFPLLGTYDRSGLMYDLFLFLQAGLVKPELYLRFVELCGGTLDHVTTQIVSEELQLLTAIAGESSMVRDPLPGFYAPLLEKVGEDRRPGEPEYAGATREFLTSQYAAFDMRYAEKIAARFDNFANLDSDLKAAAAIGYAMTKGEQAKKTLLEMVKSLQLEVDRAKVYQGLCSFREPELITETLELGISGEVSRSDSAYPLIYTAFNPYARDVLWKWIMKRYDRMHDIYAGSQQFYLFMTLALPTCGVTSEASVRRFLSGKRMKEGGSSLTRTLELLHLNAKLRKRLMRSRDQE